MALYTFNSNVLSAASVGNPTPTNTILSANGVNTISLSSVHLGLAFNPISTEFGSLCNLTVNGSVFRIDRNYHQSIFALVGSDRNYTAFQYLSTSSTVASLTATKDISTPEQRRLYTLGYI